MLKAMAVGTLCLAALAGCQDTMGGPYTQQPAVYQHQSVEYGRIVGVRHVTVRDSSVPNQTGATIVGALVGGIVGSQFGKGDGNTVMTGLGAIGGAMAGSQLAQNQPNTRVVPQWRVRLDNGGTMEIIVDSHRLSVGQRVQVIRDGNRVQLIPVH